MSKSYSKKGDCSESNESEINREVERLQSKLNSLFSYIQNVYDNSLSLDDPNKVNKFLGSAYIIDSIRDNFNATIEERNKLLVINPSAGRPNYDAMIAFDEVFAQIKFKCNQLMSANEEVSASENKNINKSSKKLPPLELHSFNGDLETWPLFYETFRTVIHENGSLTDGERIHYLISKLNGKAKDCCQGILPTAENYKVLWETLINKYNDQRVLAAMYLDKLFNVPCVDESAPVSLENFIDKFSSLISALKQLHVGNLEDLIFIHIGSKKIGPETNKLFLMSFDDPNRTPSCSDFIKFVRNQAHIMQRANNIPIEKPVCYGQPRKNTSRSTNNIMSPIIKPKILSIQERNDQCALCNITTHSILQCSKFLEKSPRERYHYVKLNKLCVNCLSNKHSIKNCNVKLRCTKCSRSHHVLLHFPSDSAVSHAHATSASAGGNRSAVHNSRSAQAIPTTASLEPVSLCALDEYTDMPADTRELTQCSTTVLLGTALCYVIDDWGNARNTVRVLVDSGAQRDLITTECCKLLNLPIYTSETKYISGVGDITNAIVGVTHLTIRSRINDNVQFTLQPYVVNNITTELPTSTIDVQKLDYLFNKNIVMADCYYYKPAKIDLIVSSNIFARIVGSNKISRFDNEPVAIETSLGYLIIGQAPTLNNTCDLNVASTFHTYELESSLNRFFEIEDVPNISIPLDPNDQQCENIYSKSVLRDSSGRYTVALPFQGDECSLGDSMQLSLRRYLSLERKLLSSASLKQEYDNVLRDYLVKGFLEPVNYNTSTGSSPHYIIPHHAVVRQDKATTKVRIVMDASMKTSSGLSLNDILHTGPNLQNDLFQIILNFRLFGIAISADICQMYLQIVVEEKYRRFQRILYRFDPNDKIQLYQITRVPFGLCCSPFLAIRTVRQLVEDEGARYPMASAVASRDIYMDDLATSCSSTAEGIQLANEAIALFRAGGFELVKFSSNSSEVMNAIPASHRISDAVEFNPQCHLKILGLHWLPAEDLFTFSIIQEMRECTKRNILSTIARLWDLMGYVGPVTLYAKVIVKTLWQIKVNWDDTPPQSIVVLWKRFVSELPMLENIKLPRHLGVAVDSKITILGFADASERAYGGVVYIHVVLPDNSYHINLVCSKSRVAPLRNVSLARLELCANLILAKLMRIVLDTYSQRCQINDIFAFTDSTVALAWIKSSPSRWQTFVANRVTKIQDLIDSRNFYHISGKENPADCLSRGLTPGDLINHPLWFRGPAFAHLPIHMWPMSHFDLSMVSDPPEMKVQVMVTTSPDDPSLLCALAQRVSSWPKLIRIVMVVLRFIKRLPKKFEISHLEIAELAVIKALQSQYFTDEFKNWKVGKKLSPAFRKLNAFVQDGIFRVGGRLLNADISFESRHPILLPRRDHIVDLIIDYFHRKYLHTGPQLLMSLLRQKYWILSARNIVRQRIQRCNICFRCSPRNEFPLMADLPSCRVKEAKPFYQTGVDYAGPLHIIPYRRRGVRSQKAYLCLFVCLVTKAVHVELASDLSTDAFLNALKRFIARRGPIAVIYSDCGTNFIGARSYLDNMYSLIDSEEYGEKFANELRDNKIEFKFNVPSAPHFVGIWESQIKSVKTHLAKVVGQQLLTFEEMLTVLTQIEAVLNSRPLSVLSSDPSEPLALTPAHFLNLTPLKSLPSEDISNEKLSNRKRVVDHLVQSFWKRWKLEYLNTLQVRQKWFSSSKPIEKGTVVLLGSDNSAPLNWPIGIIEDVFPGKDGIVRVVNVRTKTGVYRRPVVKVYPLPTQ